MHPFEDPRRRCLKADEWPKTDRAAWEKALRKDHVLDDPGPASHWSPATIHKNRRGYGRWLTFCLDIDPAVANPSPADRVTRDTVRSYLALLEEQCLAPYTVVARIDELRSVIAAMAPTRDWQWLMDLVKRLRHRVRSVKNKRALLVPAKDLYDLGVRLMETADQARGRNPAPQAIQYRDGLMIAFLAARPLRASNLAAIRIGENLLRQGSGWALLFEAHDMKNRCPLEAAFPRELVPFLETYLDRWRPDLLQNHETDRLWITHRGRPMGYKEIYSRVTSVTKRELGHPVNPHLFRDCAATSIALEDPEHVMITISILGHSSLSTAEKYYNQARSIEAGRAYQDVVMALRREIRKTRRSASRG